MVFFRGWRIVIFFVVGGWGLDCDDVNGSDVVSRAGFKFFIIIENWKAL